MLFLQLPYGVCFWGANWTRLWVDAMVHRVVEKVKANIHWSIIGVERIIHQMELKASQPPNIGCRQSRLPTLGSQPSELVFTGVIQLSSESNVVWTCCMNLETFRSFLVWRAGLYAYAVTLRWPKRGKYLFLKKVWPYLSSLCPIFIAVLGRSYRELETLAVKTTLSV
jgi:hypothetical protein